MRRELWNTERIRRELGAKTIRSASTIILRLGLKPVSREPGRSGMNLYDAADARAKIAGRRGAAGQDHGAVVGQTSTGHPLNASESSGADTGADQQVRPGSSSST